MPSPNNERCSRLDMVVKWVQLLAFPILIISLILNYRAMVATEAQLVEAKLELSGGLEALRTSIVPEIQVLSGVQNVRKNARFGGRTPNGEIRGYLVWRDLETGRYFNAGTVATTDAGAWTGAAVFPSCQREYAVEVFWTRAQVGHGYAFSPEGLTRRSAQLNVLTTC